MPPAKPTSANDHRPLHVDLRAKVIGTNVLLDRLTQEVTRLVEAQTQMAEAIARIVMPPPVHFPRAMTREEVLADNAAVAGVPHGTGAALMESFRQTAVEMDQRAYAEERRDQALDAADDAIAQSQNARSQAERVHLMNGQPPNYLIARQRSAYTDYIEDESPPPSSLAAQMAQELAEESAWDAEDPEPAPPPPPDNHALWQRRLSSWRGSRLWMPEWGPRPGQEGCKAPASLLNGRR